MALWPLWAAISQRFSKGSIVKIRSRWALVPASALAAFGSAFAAVPADITTAISTMKDDGVTVATAFVVAVIAVAAIKFLRSAK